MYVTDTHGLIWFLTEDRKLGKKAEEIFLSADRGDATVVIPSIVLLEILHICEKQNAKLKFKQIFDMVQNSLNYPVYPLDMDVVEVCQNIKETLSLHDRVIVATAKLLNARLITKDKEIIKSGLVEVVW